MLKRRESMAMKGGNSVSLNGIQHDGTDESDRSFFQKVAMSDLAIPDHMGQLTDQSENKKIWGVVLDMLFCVFESDMAEKPRDVIVLPGCNIRPLIYKSAINGVHNNSQTVSGISKFQFVIDDCSSSRKYIFGVESQQKLDVWYRVLQKASTLDTELTNDISTSNGRQSPMALNPRRLSLDENMVQTGYFPTQDPLSRHQKLNSPRTSDNSETGSCGSDDNVVNGNGHVSCQPSPRGTPGLMRNDGRRQSVQDFKKKLRRDHPEPETSKHQPVKAMHFNTKADDTSKQQKPEKKLKSFGSFENLLKFKRKKKRSQSADSTSNDSASISSASVSTDTDLSSVSRSVDIGAQESKMGKKKSKHMSRSLEFSKPSNAGNSNIVRRASEKVFSGKRPSKTSTRLGDIQEYSVAGFLHHKHHLKWQKMWCVVYRGCFYGFKNNEPEESAQISALLANCAVVYVSEKDKRQKHLYIFKLTQERTKSIYLCVSEYRELMKWLTVLQMESNSVISNMEKIRRPSESENDSVCSSLSSQSSLPKAMSSANVNSSPQSASSSYERQTSSPVPMSSATTSGEMSSAETAIATAQTNGHEDDSRSRSKKKKAPPKPPRHSSCPPPKSRDSESDTTTSGSTGSSSSSPLDAHAYGSQGT